MNKLPIIQSFETQEQIVEVVPNIPLDRVQQCTMEQIQIAMEEFRFVPKEHVPQVIEDTAEFFFQVCTLERNVEDVGVPTLEHLKDLRLFVAQALLG